MDGLVRVERPQHIDQLARRHVHFLYVNYLGHLDGVTCVSRTVEVPSDDGGLKEIAMCRREYDTEKIVVIDGEAYYTHPNGGSAGAWDRQCGDGVWREYPVEPSRRIEREEARRLILDWGYDSEEVACATRVID